MMKAVKKTISSRTGKSNKVPVKKILAKKALVSQDFADEVAENDAAASKIPVGKRPKSFPIVGFGASAGGLKAFTTILKHLDSNLGMAYVLIMHLSPNHKSALTEILGSKTKIPVQTVKDGMEVMRNNIYVIPPNTFMSVVDGHLKLAPRSLNSIGNFAVDYFFTGLASVYKNNAIGVILSGTASDGTLGLKAIKAEGGITFAQDETAEFSGMPQNAYDSGYVDFRLPPEGIANELAQLVKMPYTVLPYDKIGVRESNELNESNEPNESKEENPRTGELKKVLSIVKSKTGIDFFMHYKQASIYRRVMRRMALNKFENLEEYSDMLKKNPREISALYDDFLINVTKFFRDPDFYKTLIKEVFPSFVKEGKPVDPIRIWVAGCATGEEAYSIAIHLFDFLEKRESAIPIQIFASDLDASAIEKARLGIYPVSALQGVSQNHLKHYFKKLNGHYQIVKAIREVCVFSNHNLLKDPPFSRMNLISCQNVLIYLETQPQRKILQAFHYSIVPNGYLFLGKSETIGTSVDLFDSLDKKIRIYSRKPTKVAQLEFTVQPRGSVLNNQRQKLEQNIDVESDMGRLMLSRFVHPSVVVNKNLKIIQFFGITAPYLAPVTGKASFDLLKMIREDLAIDLRSLLHQARKTENVAIKEGIRIFNKKVLQEISIEVVPVKISGDAFFLIAFKESAFIEPSKMTNGTKSKDTGDQKENRIATLEAELVQSRGVIRTTNEEYETTYEELQANNEEILSSNEELQSVNEELETSKEELQSSNEELTTTNEELQKRNVELFESQKELKKVNEQLEQFAFISSHDLQEPLRKIQTFSDFLSNPEASLNPYAEKYSSKINASAARMSNLLKDLVRFSVDNKADGKKSVEVDLNDIIREVMKDFEVIIDTKGAVVNLSHLPVIHAHPVQMTHLFHNLISNALKFAKKTPVISISSAEARTKDFSKHPELMRGTNYVSISVTDNGIGFNQKYTPRMFTLFQRLNDNKEAEGTGVGLAICKKIVEDHKGFIFATGKENKGATFTVFLPKEYY